MREILDGFLVAVQLVLLIMMGLPVLYLLFFAIAGLFYNPGASDVESTNFRRIAVLIPGYREDAVIVNVASCALQQDYPEDKFGIFIIADSFLPETVAELKKMPVRVIEVV
ncbi:MAG: glycosyltransferase, partial [Syntrophothermus sp.]